MRRTRSLAAVTLACLAAGLSLVDGRDRRARPAAEDPAVSMWSKNPATPWARRSGRPARTRRTSPAAA